MWRYYISEIWFFVTLDKLEKVITLTRYKNLRNYFFKLIFSRTSYQIPGHFQDFPGPYSDSRTFQSLENSVTKFQDFPGRTLYIVSTLR